MSKRVWAVILAVCLLAISACGLAEPAEAAPERAQLTEDRENRTVQVVRSPEHLTVANTTQITGRFFSGMWGSGTSDIDVRSLVHGCDLVRWNGEDGAFETDPTVVSGIVVTENEHKDRSYMLVLCDDMVYSDGTPVTAWDYAFSFLLQMSEEIDDMGGVAVDRDYLAGGKEYAAKSAPLMGTDFVRLAADGTVVTDGTVPEGSRLVEQVRYVRDMTMPADENGEYTIIAFDAIGAKEPMTLYHDGLGELLYTGGIEQPENADPVNVDASGYVTDWHYENGVKTFENGTHPLLPGVKVIADDTLTITVDHEYLPFFYELGLLSCEPCPISLIAPGVKVMDDGEGVYLANAPREDEAEPADPDAPVFTTELLEKTLLDPETGYLFHPGVSTGPYILMSFDGTTAEFEINPLYKGSAENHKPSVPYLTYTLADNATMVEKLATGEYDIINKVTMADTLNAAMALMRSGEFTREEVADAEPAQPSEDDEAVAVDAPWHTDERFGMSNYPRTGLSFISFNCAHPTVSSLAVRQAIAWSMDRDQIVQDYTAGFGVRMDCYSGLGQWMVSLVDGTAAPPVKQPEDPNDEAAQAAYEAELEKWEELSLDNLMDYELDLDKARALLDNDGWRTEVNGQKLNEKGLREKDGVVLDLVLIYPRGNAIARTLERNMVQNLREIGVGLTLVPVDMPELLARYYRQMSGPVSVTVDGVVEQREVDMIYLASNFDIIFDPSVHFSTEENGHNWSYTGCADEELYQLALDMRHTEPADVYGYVKKWIAFEEHFNEVLPMIPLYSNVYFDFYTDKLTNYNIDESITWGQALVGARMAGLTEELPEAEPDETEPAEDEIEIVDAGDEAEPQEDAAAADQGEDIEIIDDFASSFGG